MVRIALVTSRAPLRIRGEQRWPVSPLGLPISTRSPTVEEVAGSPFAAAMLEEGLALARKLGDRLGVNDAPYVLAQTAWARGDHDLVARRFEEGVTLSGEMGGQANLGYFLEGLAVVAGVRGEAKCSICLFGAAEGLLEALEAPVYDYFEPNRSLYERTKAAMLSQLGESAFEEKWDKGSADL